MRLTSRLYAKAWNLFLFLSLQTLCILMVCKNGTVQHFTIFEKLRNMQYSLWDSGTSMRNYINLKDVSRNHFMQNLQLMNENEYLKKELLKQKGEEYISSILLNRTFDFSWAKVVKNSINGNRNYLIIDKGSKDGIAEEMGVIMPNGIIGIVMKVGKNYAYINSFLNIDQQISAKVGSEEAFGTMSWDKKNLNQAILNDIPQHISIKTGDTVYTSGQSSIYPDRIPLGTVEESHIVNGTHQAISVKLFLNYKNIDYVIIVKNLDKKEIDSLINAK